MEKSTTSGSVEGDAETGNYVNSSQNPETLKHQSLPYTSQSMEKNRGERKNYKRAANRGRKGSRELAGRNYPLRSSDTTVRVLRSTSAAKKSPSNSVHTLLQPAAKKSPSDPVHTLVQPAAKRIKKGRPAKRSPNNDRPAKRSLNNEFSKIRQRVRYILNRMNYEQSLLEAYASEGWKRQSLEKIRPEKELERAKAEIVRCKLRIREAFQNLDYLLSVGKLEESLFDSEGEISSEDIVCATCSSQDVTLNNDIILCDGVCDRGFHQNCLNPSLLTEDIPVGDEGWLCPACDCKIDCIDVINELQGTDLSISDTWEKVFPEAAALAHGSKKNDVSDLPSDDSEDNDFDPDIAEEHVAGHEEGSSEEDGDQGSDSDDSNFITSSDNSEQLKEKEKVDDLGLPSEDSEDDEYDPAGPDSDKDIEEKQDESDFTSDSDDFCAEIAKSCGQDEVSSGDKSGDPTNGLQGATVQANTAISSLTSKDFQMDQDVVLPVSGKRQVQRLDYKKLYDDAYGEAPSDSSDGEEWFGKSTPEKNNEEQGEVGSFACKSSGGTGAVHQSNQFTPQSARQSLHPDDFHGLVNGQHAGEVTSNGSNSTAQRKQFGPIINERLNEHFKTDQYPSRAVKESLAQELGLTFRQVNKWFESARRYTRLASNKNGTHNHSSKRNRSSVVARMEVTDPKQTMMEKPYVCKNEGIKQDSPVKQDIDGRLRMHVPPESSQSYTTTSKGESRENHGKNTSSRYVRRPKDGSAEDQILGIELEDEGSDSDGPNFVTTSDNSEPLKDKEKVDDLGLPSEDSGDDEYDPAGPDSDKDIEKKQSSSDESDYTSDSDDFCAEIAKSCGQDGVPSGAKAGGDPVNDLEGTTLQANTAISDLLPKDLEMDQDAHLPVSGRRQVQCLDYKKLYDEAHGEAPSDSSDGEDWSGKSTPEKDNGKQCEAGSFARKSSRRTGAVHQTNELTPQSARQSLHRDTFHCSVNGQHAGELLTPNGSNSTAQRRQFGPIINQRLHEHFKTDQYPSRAVKESLAQELGLTFRQVNKWFETTRHNTRVAADKNRTHVENHSTKGNRSSVVASIEVTGPKEIMVEKLNVCKNDVATGDLTSGNLNDSIKQDSLLKEDISGGLRTHVTPPNSSQRYTTTSGLVGCRKGESRENHGKNTSRYVGRPKEGYAEDLVLGLEVVDEGTKKAVLQELKKRKMGR